jgi:hypothetical protein
MKAKANHKKKTGMNGTEQEYADRLEDLKYMGEIVWYGFEAIKLKLADNTFYTPDFVVVNDEYEIEIHEVKGFWRDDARVKIKVAAEKYQLFRFIAASKISKKDGGGWRIEEF